jgi:hypothetical protein
MCRYICEVETIRDVQFGNFNMAHADARLIPMILYTTMDERTFVFMILSVTKEFVIIFSGF